MSGLIVLARCQVAGAEHDAARATLEKVLRVDPDNRIALNLLATDARRHEHWTAAVGYYQRLALADPADESVPEALAQVKAMLDNEPTVDAGDDTHISVEETPTATGPEPDSSDRGSIVPDGEPLATEPAADDVSAGEADMTGGNTQHLATKTLADIYLAQGYRERAVEVLQQILAQNPEREDILATIEQLGTDDAGTAQNSAPAVATAGGADATSADDTESPARTGGTAVDGDDANTAADRETAVRRRRERFEHWLDRVTERNGDS